MSEPGQRMLDGSQPPDAKSVARWLGTGEHRRWTRLLSFIEANYPGIFTPDWIFGGKKYGWGLRFKKSKSFCTLIPERNRLVVQIVLGAKEREKTEKVLPEFSPSLRTTYAEATTYHDGKWLAIVADCDTALDDIERLLALKRRPKRA
jgi:hypothetical protein